MLFDDIINQGTEEIKSGKNTFFHTSTDVHTDEGSFRVEVQYDPDGSPKSVVVHKKIFGIF